MGRSLRTHRDDVFSGPEIGEKKLQRPRLVPPHRLGAEIIALDPE
jgi:hypothetical protein